MLEFGLRNINLHYFIDGYSNLKNSDGEYIAYVDEDHLNQKFVNKWLHSFILKNTRFTINNLSELKSYISKSKSLQNRLQ